MGRASASIAHDSTGERVEHRRPSSASPSRSSSTPTRRRRLGQRRRSHAGPLPSRARHGAATARGPRPRRSRGAALGGDLVRAARVPADVRPGRGGRVPGWLGPRRRAASGGRPGPAGGGGRRRGAAGAAGAGGGAAAAVAAPTGPRGGRSAAGPSRPRGARGGPERLGRRVVGGRPPSRAPARAACAASAPSLTARIAAARRSSSRTTSARPIRAGLLGEPRVLVGGHAAARSGISPSVCTTISSRACASRSRMNWHRSRPIPPAGRRRAAPRGRRASPTASSAPNTQVRVGDAEHREHVLGRDLLPAVGHAAARACRARRGRSRSRAGDQRDAPRRRSSMPSCRRRAAAPSPICPTVGRAKSKRWQRSTTVGSTLCGLGRGEHEDRVAAAAPRASSGTRSTPAGQHVRLVEDVDLAAARRRARRRPSRAGRGCRRPSCSTPRPSR